MLDEFRSSHITWDKATSRIYSTITANESDENGRKLVVQIINGGQVEDLTGASLHLYWETRDKLHDGLDAFKAVDLKKGEFELSYTTGMLSNKGVLNANLVLVDAVGRVVSERFKITVTEGIDNDAIQSENSFTTLTQALIDISNLEQNYAPRLNDLTAQLQQRPPIKVFEEIPAWDMLSDGEIGAVIKPIYPYNYDFSGANGADWDKYEYITKKYTSTSYANTNEPQLIDGSGVLKVDKPAEVQFSTLEQRLAYKLNFKDKGKYRIKIDMMRPIYEGVNRGNCGFTITPSTSNTTNYPINTLMPNGYALLLSGVTGSTNVLPRVRKVMNSSYATDQYIATNGGYATTTAERLGLPQGELITFELEISPTTIKLWIDGQEYLNIAEDLSFLNVTKANLVLFCGNMDLNSLSSTAKFDNLVIREG